MRMKSSLENFVSGLKQQGVARSPYVRDALLRIDRKDFVLSEYQDEAHANYPLPIGHGQTISQPYTVAFMLDALDPKPGEKILDIGSGSGWTTALLAHIVSTEARQQTDRQEQHGMVFAVELIPELYEQGKTNCEKYHFVSRNIATFFCQDGNLGLPSYAPFDKILCSASLHASDVPQEWKTQLRVGGRIVTSIQNSVWMFDKIQNNQWTRTEYPGFVFVPLISR